MIITADQDGSDDLITLLTNGKAQAQQPVDDKNGKETSERRQITWVDDVEEMLDPMKKEFAVYETTVFLQSKASNSIVYYNQTFSIPNEGVFSTFFLFGKHKPLETTSTIGDDIGDFIDDIFGEDEEKEEISNHSHNRVLKTDTAGA